MSGRQKEKTLIVFNSFLSTESLISFQNQQTKLDRLPRSLQIDSKHARFFASFVFIIKIRRFQRRSDKVHLQFVAVLPSDNLLHYKISIKISIEVLNQIKLKLSK
jgi:hypothetical protein